MFNYDEKEMKELDTPTLQRALSHWTRIEHESAIKLNALKINLAFRREHLKVITGSTAALRNELLSRIPAK